jgi:hypothetical protein
MDVTLTTLDRGQIGFKSAGYETWNSVTYVNTAKNDQDWSGLYVAVVEDTAKGYLPDMVESGAGTAYIHKVILSEAVKMIVCMDDGFKTGSYDMGALKLALAAKHVAVDTGDLLMPKLGQLGYLFKCYNNEDGAIEIIVPNNMVGKLVMNRYKKVKISGYLPGTETLL